MSDETNVIAQVETPLGRAQLHLRLNAKVSATATVTDAHPELPAGMRVDRTVRIDRAIKALADIAPMHVRVPARLRGRSRGRRKVAKGSNPSASTSKARSSILPRAMRTGCWTTASSESGCRRIFGPTRSRPISRAGSMHYRPQGFRRRDREAVPRRHRDLPARDLPTRARSPTPMTTNPHGSPSTTLFPDDPTRQLWPPVF